MKSLAELQAIRDKARAQISLRENSDNSIRVLVGMATCGIAQAPALFSPPWWTRWQSAS